MCTACPNGIVEATEQCDDANSVNGDGCSSTCALEGTPACFTNGIGFSTCTMTPYGVYCGNGVLEAAEVCDDGN